MPTSPVGRSLPANTTDTRSDARAKSEMFTTSRFSSAVTCPQSEKAVFVVIVLYKTGDAALPIPPSLSLAVALGGLRVRLPIGLLIVGMFGLPPSPAVADHLRVQRISPDLLPMVFGAAAPLALRLAVNTLLKSVWRRSEKALAIWAAAGRDQCGSSEGRNEPTSKEITWSPQRTSTAHSSGVTISASCHEDAPAEVLGNRCIPFSDRGGQHRLWNAHTLGVDRNLSRASAIHHYLGNYQWAQRNRRLCAHGRTRELLLRIARVLGRGCVAETPFRKTGAQT